MRKRFFLSAWLFLAAVAAFAQVTVTPTSAFIEVGQSVNMTASGSDFLIWTPNQWLTDTVGPTTTATPLQTTTYTVTGYEPGDDRVVNGDFEQGNFGFDSDYYFADDLWTEGFYNVDTDASQHHSNFVGHGHGGSGKFMMINGASTPGVKVWTQDIEVTPHRYYAFSTWVISLHRTNPAKLQFSINETQIGDVFVAPDPPLVPGVMPDNWENFYQLWYSGNNTSATITILNQNTQGDGNDFGLDDISFREMVPIGAAECTITINTLSASDDDIHACFGETVSVPFLDNDNVPESCANLTYEIVASASHGTAACTDDEMTYAPDAGFSGTDTFRYRVTCGGFAAEANVTVSVSPEYRETLDHQACNVFEWKGLEFDKSIDTAWIAYGAATNGCDSIYELHLTVNYSDTVTFTRSACDSLEWHGEVYYQSDTIDFWTTNSNGCERLERLYLTIGNNIRMPFEVVECDSFYWDRSNRWYYHSDTDSVIVPATFGCDTTFFLYLTIHKSQYEDPVYVTSCRSYEWHNIEYAQTGIYYFDSIGEDGCPVYEELHLTIQTDSGIGAISGEHSVFVASNLISGIYRYEIDTVGVEGPIEWQVSNGWMVIDSDANSCRIRATTPGEAVLTARFNVPGCGMVERSFNINAGYFATDEALAIQCQLYPNPTRGTVTVEAEGLVSIRVLNSLGQTLVSEEQGGAEKAVLHLEHLAPSVYLIEIETAKGTVKEKLVLYR